MASVSSTAVPTFLRNAVLPPRTPTIPDVVVIQSLLQSGMKHNAKWHEFARNTEIIYSPRVFPYRDENETQRTPYITFAIIALNVFVWLFIQGAGGTVPLATSV